MKQPPPPFNLRITQKYSRLSVAKSAFASVQYFTFRNKNKQTKLSPIKTVYDIQIAI